MSSKNGSIIELFIDKAVLAIAGLAAVVILFIFVIGSPKIEHDGEKRGPSEIDSLINKKAIQLQERLKNEPNTNKQYKPKENEYLALLADSIQDVNVRINFPLPGNSTISPITPGNRVYRIPQIGQIEKPCAAVARMAAFVPTEELSATLTYENSETKLEDMDIVTVESSIDAKTLYSQFREAFAAKNIPQEWRKEQYTRPVFAKVQLQRKTQQPDGSWSDWADIPLTKICYLKKNLAIPQQASEYVMEMAMVQFAKSAFRNEILQPPVYFNAIPAEPWLSPSLYNERQKRLAKEQEEIRRQEIEAGKAKKLQDKAAPPAQRQQTTRQPTRPSATPTPTTGRIEKIPKVESQRTADEASKFDAIKLKPETNPVELERLVFWAHDDTTEPGGKYQYRTRIGVFNPIAGTNWFSEEQQNLRDQIVLWSNFADVNEVVEIPQRLHFFATDIQEIDKGSSIDKTVQVVVARYVLGNWVSRKYSVKSGDEIGKADEAPDTRLEQAGISSEAIDFSTGTVMVDTRRVSELVGTRTREYNELLYSRDGKEIEKVPIKERYWPAKVVKIYKEISAALDAEPVKLLNWSGMSGGTGRTSSSQEPASPPADGQPRQ